MYLIDSMCLVDSIVLYSVDSVVTMPECCLTVDALPQWSYYLSLILSCCPQDSIIKRFPTVFPSTACIWCKDRVDTKMYVLI